MMSGDYSEGDWFAVPLREGGFAVGVIARVMPHKDGILLGTSLARGVMRFRGRVSSLARVRPARYWLKGSVISLS